MKKQTHGRCYAIAKEELDYTLTGVVSHVVTHLGHDPDIFPQKQNEDGLQTNIKSNQCN